MLMNQQEETMDTKKNLREIEDVISKAIKKVNGKKRMISVNISLCLLEVICIILHCVR